MKKSICSRIFFFIILLFLLSSCTTSTSTPITPTETIEEVTVDGWVLSSPEKQGMDSKLLAEMLKTIQENDHAIDSVSIIRNGYLVLDASVYPYQAGSKHIIHSCTKSIVSALIGIAIHQGYIESVDQPLLEFFPDRTAANLESDKESITLEHLLTMTSGLRCRDSYLYQWEGLREMKASEDWVQYVLDLPMVKEPGTTFEYCNGGSFLLSALLQESVGMDAQAFAEEFLFGPLDITNIDWPTNPQDINIGWGELRMRPLDMAKIGQLYLMGGIWEEEQIIPENWIAESTREHVSATLEDGYGYQWWTDDSGFYLALGYAGQFIYVIPELEMVVVFTSNLEDRDFYIPQQLLTTYIIPAAESSSPLPENPKAKNDLDRYVENLQNP